MQLFYQRKILKEAVEFAAVVRLENERQLPGLKEYLTGYLLR
jgi:hypothetical protein